ncbi:MAG: hypothetical protein M1831_000028 [Alyxoria varia]|nr:MAG: hypothetical protein M1831_000028 [Alyxoria varia]
MLGMFHIINYYTTGVYHDCPSHHRRSYLSSATPSACCPCGKKAINKAYLSQARGLTEAETSIARLQFGLKIAVLVASVLLVLLIRKAYIQRAQIRGIERVADTIEAGMVKMRRREEQLDNVAQENSRLLAEAHARIAGLERIGLMRPRTGGRSRERHGL